MKVNITKYQEAKATGYDQPTQLPLHSRKKVGKADLYHGRVETYLPLQTLRAIPTAGQENSQEPIYC